jgi:hypothetical protein
LVGRVHVFHPAIGGQQFARRGGGDRNDGGDAVVQAVGFGARHFLHGAFEPGQGADIDHAVVGAGGHRGACEQDKGKGQQAFARRDQHPARRSKHVITPVLVDA